MAGIATEVIASIGKRSFREKLLITHNGFSGPAILQISSFWKPGEKVTLDLAPERQVFGHLLDPGARRDAVAAGAALREVLPIRLAERWLELNPFKKWTNVAIEEAERALHHFQFVPSGTEGFAKAEVTAGGVDTNELSAKTMECAKVPGLYFVGEVVDVTGNWEAITSSGPGHPDSAQGRRCDREVIRQVPDSSMPMMRADGSRSYNGGQHSAEGSSLTVCKF